MKTLITEISSLVTVDTQGQGYKSGREMQDIGEIKNGAILFDKNVLWLGTTEEVTRKIDSGELQFDQKFSARGNTVLPGFVDSHTHVVFGGNRAEEFGKRLKGVSYQQIAEEGGGIQTTVKGTREASVQELYQKGKQLSESALGYGTTTMEVKSGYGLTTESELNQLKAIRMLINQANPHIVPTFLGAHDFPPELKRDRRKYIDIIKNEMIPMVVEEGLAEFCDAFIDDGYYTLDEGREVLQSGLDAGLGLKVHCDELKNTGSSSMVAEMGAISADHLLCISDKGIEDLAKAGTVATLLPGTAYFIRKPYAPARKLIEKDAIVALSTDCNPGSSFTENMQLILSLSVINMGMTAEEAISAATINGAHALRRGNKLGSLEVGKSADLIIADCDSYIEMFYHFGVNHVKEVWIEGNKVFENDDKMFSYKH